VNKNINRMVYKKRHSKKCKDTRLNQDNMMDDMMSVQERNTRCAVNIIMPVQKKTAWYNTYAEVLKQVVQFYNSICTTK